MRLLYIVLADLRKITLYGLTTIKNWASSGWNMKEIPLLYNRHIFSLPVILSGLVQKVP